jgi:hypothetical protein
VEFEAGHPLRNFKNFLFLVWKHLNLPDPTPAQYDLADYLQYGPRRCVIEAFRGEGKSWITSAYVCWRLLFDPQLKFLVVSASKDRADAFSTFTKRLISEMPILQHLMAKEGQRDSNVAFDVGPTMAAHAPSVKSVGITGQISGSRADEVIADDIETLNNSLTQMLRDRLAEAIKEFEAVMTPKPTSRIIFLGTPQSEMSIYNGLPARGYEMRVWPARVPTADKVISYKGALAPFVTDMIARGVPAGTPTDPTRFGELELLEREASYGRSGFALQFMLDTSMSDAERYPLKLRDLVVISCNDKIAPVQVSWASSPDLVIGHLPAVGLAGDRFYHPMYVAKEWVAYTGSVMAIDPAGRGKDETGYAVVKILSGLLYITASGGLKGGYTPENLKTLSLVAKEQGVNEIVIESNFGDGMFAELLKPVLTENGHSCTVVDVRHGAQKELRIIETLEPILNQHRLVLDEKIILSDAKVEVKYQLLYQLTRLTKDRGALAQDDRIDALAIAVKYWTEHMAKDTKKAAEEHRQKLLDEELRKFMETATGQQSKGASWIHLPGQ